MMIIPGMSFVFFGNRLGWGELHYERFLSNSRLKSLMKVGIAWSMQMVKEVPVESTDLIMDWIVTERETYNTSVQFS
ncbi:MAG: hypothetical protein KDD62_13005, partial [Bdellovibrionales bacterium]|nr:hypothetical protein [Bdellovibrionales bacterium]